MKRSYFKKVVNKYFFVFLIARIPLTIAAVFFNEGRLIPKVELQGNLLYPFLKIKF